MKRVLLVNTNTEKAPYPVPPLGLSLLAVSLEINFEVHLFDGTFQPAESLPDLLDRFCPHYIGVGIRNIDDVVIDSGIYYVDQVLKDFITPLKNYRKAPLILGGSGFSIFPKELLIAYGVDYGVIGEGEKAFARLLQALESATDPKKIPGVITRDGDSFRFLMQSPRAGDLVMPFSDVDSQIDFLPYRARGSYPIQTKRGCAHKCLYCSYVSIEGNKYRLRPAKSVVDEIESIHDRLGDVMIEIVDSTFNDPKGHAEAICREIIARKIKVRLRTMGVNPGRLTGRLIELMRKAGFAQIDCTPDSASEKMLLNLRKNFNKNKLIEAARLVKEFDMPTMWFFLFGGPGESKRTIDETFEFIDAHINPADMVHMTEGLRIYPHTQLYEKALEDNLLLPNDDLLKPVFYVSPKLGKERIHRLIEEKAATRPNCILASQSTPDPSMIREAMALREEEGLDEPMFRSLLRIRKKNWK